MNELRAARRRSAVEMRAQGLPLRRIAEALGVSHPTVLDDLRTEANMTDPIRRLYAERQRPGRATGNADTRTDTSRQADDYLRALTGRQAPDTDEPPDQTEQAAPAVDLKQGNRGTTRPATPDGPTGDDWLRGWRRALTRDINDEMNHQYQERTDHR